MMDDPRDAEGAANALPLNLEAEQALLGQLMFDNDVHRQVHDVLTAEDFSEPFHQRLYAAIAAAITAGRLADPTILQTEFKHDPAFVEFGGFSYLFNLVDRSPPGSVARDYAALVADAGLRRRLIKMAAETIQQARSPELSGYQVVAQARAELEDNHARVAAIFANRCNPQQLDEVRAVLPEGLGMGALPEDPLLVAPLLSALIDAVDGTLVSGDESLLTREVRDVIVGAMTAENLLERLREGAVVITPSDRSDNLLALLSAHAAEGFPALAGIILNGGVDTPDPVRRLVDGLDSALPVIRTDLDTYETARRMGRTRGRLSRESTVKVDTALSMFERYVDAQALIDILDVARTDVVTPLMFEHDLLARARAHRRHIVLPEGTDDRILKAASTLMTRDVVDLTVLGEESALRARAAELGLDFDGVRILSPFNEELVARFAERYAKERAHKGVTLDRATEVVQDVSFFGTMMVLEGLADGMVSGAAHTTAHTITPSFQVIKTAPGTSIVSSVFFMCLADRVLVYGDCAINPDPTAQQLADIAISSADTAKQFHIEPRVAMLSYSTGESGSGSDVDKVREATRLVKERRPDLIVDGPMQYDAAVEPSVAASKAPGSPVAGQATVLIFPDLNTGNNTYKAVQRSAGAVAVGPVLQGLRRPVNDLSRGALVQDIVNTVAITAIQAQQLGDNKEGA